MNDTGRVHTLDCTKVDPLMPLPCFLSFFRQIKKSDATMNIAINNTEAIMIPTCFFVTERPEILKAKVNVLY